MHTSLGILSCHHPEMNKEPPCGHWHQVAFPLLGVSMVTRQCLRPWEPVKETHCEEGQRKVRGPDL